jgi:iron complex transport system substrate-binding protein
MKAHPRRLVRLILAGCLLIIASPRSVLSEPSGAGGSLPRTPTRIVSLVPSVTEILFAIGAEDTLVGVTDFCDYPEAARRKPRVGGMIAPSLETIVAARPEVVVATSDGNRQETFDQLRRLQIPVYSVAPGSVENVLALVVMLGELTGRRQAAGDLADSLRRRILAVSARVGQLPRRRVLYVIWPEPLIVPGRGTLISELIRLAGGESVTADVTEAYPRYSTEAALARRPEVIFLARHGSERTGSAPITREKWERFGDLPAIRFGRLHVVPGDLLHRYGPRVVDGLELLARLTHPEAFASPTGGAAAHHGDAPR